jgi:anti-anti-sigma factor
VADIESIAKGGVRVARICDPQVTGEEYVHRAGIKLNKIVNEMGEPAQILDLCKVKFMASAMIGKLVLLSKQCASRDICFSVCSLDKNVAEAIQLTQIDKILPVYPNQDEAISAALAK